MTLVDENTATPPADAAGVEWDLEPLVTPEGVDGLLDRAAAQADELAGAKGTIAAMDGVALARFLGGVAEVQDSVQRALSYCQLQWATAVTDPARGAALQSAEERGTAIGTTLVFFPLEWAVVEDDRASALMAVEVLAPYRHHLENLRRERPHLLSEPEERLLAEKAVTGRSAWSRLFQDLVTTVSVDLDGSDQPVTLEAALSRLSSPDREVRRTTAEAVTAALAPGLRTRAYVFNTLLADKSVDDRLRSFPSWISSMNLANEASDDSVEALVSAVQRRYDLPRRWYALKARILGVERLADYDRMAAVTDADTTIGWDEGRQIVLDAYASFSPDMASAARRFFDERWIDAADKPGKLNGAFCAYTVPSHHPYVLLSWSGRRRDVLTLAHELGHGLHAWMARGQTVFSQMTPLTVAETASVFGETVTFGRLLEATTDPDQRLALLAESIEGAIGTVFRQTAMNRFEHSVHTARREEGELSVDRFGELWAASQTELLGPSVEVTEGYRSWWSYIPHFIGSPGYVYAYAYGQLFALSVYRRYTEQGSDFVPRYLHMLSAGGSVAPEDLGLMVGCDLADPGFWDGGLAIVEEQLDAAETAAFEAGRLEA